MLYLCKQPLKNDKTPFTKIHVLCGWRSIDDQPTIETHPELSPSCSSTSRHPERVRGKVSPLSQQPASAQRDISSARFNRRAAAFSRAVPIFRESRAEVYSEFRSCHDVVRARYRHGERVWEYFEGGRKRGEKLVCVFVEFRLANVWRIVISREFGKIQGKEVVKFCDLSCWKNLEILEWRAVTWNLRSAIKINCEDVFLR